MQASSYRYRYNGKEQLSRFGGRYDYGFRMYDAGLARFLSVDPLTKKYPYVSPYIYSLNRPLDSFDPDGRDVIVLNAPTSAFRNGHLAMLVGNDKDGWKFISKDGTSARIGVSGPSDISPSSALGRVTYRTIQEWADSHNRPDENGRKKYVEGYRITQDANKDEITFSEGLKHAKSDYNLIGNNCADCVRNGLEKAGYDEPFNNKKTAILGKEARVEEVSTLPIQPKKQYEALKRNVKGTIIKL